jgi:hypothetical protein
VNTFHLILLNFTARIAFLHLCSCPVNGPHTQIQTGPGAVIVTTIGETNADHPEKLQTFTNANVVMWVPKEATKIWDGPTSSVKSKRISAINALPETYKISVEIQVYSQEEFKKNEDLYGGWYFQEHPTVSARDGSERKQFRKDIRDDKHHRILLINGMVEKTDTFDEDVQIITKMIESIKLIHG